jgi:hypothetical protein
MLIVLPATIAVTLATLMLVAPATLAADSVVVKNGVTDATLMFWSAAAAAAASVVHARDLDVRVARVRRGPGAGRAGQRRLTADVARVAAARKAARIHGVRRSRIPREATV